MRTTNDGALLRQLDTLFNVGAIRELTDGQLLERFSTGPREAAELAFAALVERHAEMVLRVCRAQLDNRHDTDDAFQATFLVLVKKARTLWVRDSLGPWLHQVAFRTASCARAAAARRQRHERRFAEAAATVKTDEDPSRPELETVLHEEIDRLPERYRSAIVLCDLQGLNSDEAARRLGRPVGTVKCWRFRGRERLRDRLRRRGVVPAAGVGAALAFRTARAGQSTSAADQTIRAAVKVLSGSVMSAEISVSVRMLVKGALKTMAFDKLRTAFIQVSALLFVSAGAGAFAWVAAKDSKDARGPAPGAALAAQDHKASDPRERGATWPLRLADAIGIGLKNSPLCRVITIGPDGVPRKIAPVDGATDLQNFRGEVMTLLSAIERSYWQLGQAQVQVGAIEEAVKQTRKTLEREEADRLVGKGTAADVAEAAQRLEQCNLDVVTRTSDVITAERELRKSLGLPAADGRRIVPVTPPTESQLEPDWDKSVATMLERQPSVAQARAQMKRAEADTSEESRARLDQLKASFEYIVRVATHALARGFLDIDSNDKQFKTASRLRAAAAQRLDAQRAYYEEGRITIDRFLDAVSQHASAIATEAQFRATCNNALVALELAKGTLLDHYGIDVVDFRKPNSGTVAAQDGAATVLPQDPVGPIQSPLLPSSATSNAPVALPPSPVAAKPESISSNLPPLPPTPASTSTAGPAATTYSFEFSVNLGSKPIEVRGSITIGPAAAAESSKGN